MLKTGPAVVCNIMLFLLLLNVLLSCFVCRDVEDSLDSLLEDAGLEGIGSEDGTDRQLIVLLRMFAFMFFFEEVY